MKKVGVLLSVMLFSFVLVGCNKGGDAPADNKPANPAPTTPSTDADADSGQTEDKGTEPEAGTINE